MDFSMKKDKNTATNENTTDIKVKEKKVKAPKEKAPKTKGPKPKKEKKPLTEAQVERRNEIIKTFKDMIPPAVAVAVVALLIFIAVKLANKPEVYEIVKPYFYEVEEGVTVPDMVLESDDLIFTLDPATTHFTVKKKSTGKVWSSYAKGAEDDPIALGSEKERLLSNLILTYTQVNGLETTFDSNSVSVANKYYEVVEEDGAVKVRYSMGNIEREYIVPPVMLAEDFEKWKANLDKKQVQYITDYYKKYDIDKLSPKDDKDELLRNYPSMKDHVIYVSRQPKKNVKEVLEQYFEQAGYTTQDYAKDKALDKSEAADDRPIFNVEMIFRVEGDDLVVEIPFSSIQFKSQYPVSSIIPLPYFGAVGEGNEGFMFVPEGGGALINYNNGKKSQNDYYANIYGWDMCLRRDYVIHNTRAYFNVFGQANGNDSYICIMEDGASYGSVRAAISGKLHSYNYVDARYSIIPGEKYNIANLASSDVYSFLDSLPDESIVQRYRFIDSGDYVDMAKEYGNYLENRYGDDFTLRGDAEAPVAVEIVGAVDKVRQIMGVPVSRPLKLTTFKEAGEMIEELNAEDIGDLSVKMTGWLNGGVKQKILKHVNVISALGGAGNLKKLTKKADELGVDLYLDGITQYEHQSTIFNGFFSFSDAARFLTKERAELYQYSDVTYAAREGAKSYYLLNSDESIKAANKLVKTTDKYNANVSFNDIGMDLSSDFTRKKTVSRESTLDKDVEVLKAASDKGQKIMVNMGNDYVLPYADMITGMELKGSEYTLLDKCVPFYQIAIHGFVDYTGEPINICGNEEEQILMSAEYGAGLYYTLMKESCFALQKTLYPDYYGSEYAEWKDRMIETCTRYNRELGHTFGQRIVGHSVDGDVTCTTYEDGTRVYVNYSFLDSYKTADGIEVGIRDYKVVKK